MANKFVNLLPTAGVIKASSKVSDFAQEALEAADIAATMMKSGKAMSEVDQAIAAKYPTLTPTQRQDIVTHAENKMARVEEPPKVQPVLEQPEPPKNPGLTLEEIDAFRKKYNITPGKGGKAAKAAIPEAPKKEKTITKKKEKGFQLVGETRTEEPVRPTRTRPLLESANEETAVVPVRSGGTTETVPPESRALLDLDANLPVPAGSRDVIMDAEILPEEVGSRIRARTIPMPRLESAESKLPVSGTRVTKVQESDIPENIRARTIPMPRLGTVDSNLPEEAGDKIRARAIPMSRLDSATSEVAPEEFGYGYSSKRRAFGATTEPRKKVLPTQEDVAPAPESSKTVGGLAIGAGLAAPLLATQVTGDGEGTTPPPTTPAMSAMAGLPESRAAGAPQEDVTKTVTPLPQSVSTGEAAIIGSPKTKEKMTEVTKEAKTDPVAATVTAGQGINDNLPTIEQKDPEAADVIRTSIGSAMEELKRLNAELIAAQKETSEQYKKDMFEARMAEALTGFAQALVKYGAAAEGSRRRIDVGQYYKDQPANFKPVYDQIQDEFKQKMEGIRQQVKEAASRSEKLQERMFEQEDKKTQREFEFEKQKRGFEQETGMVDTRKQADIDVANAQNKLAIEKELEVLREKDKLSRADFAREAELRKELARIEGGYKIEAAKVGRSEDPNKNLTTLATDARAAQQRRATDRRDALADANKALTTKDSLASLQAVAAQYGVESEVPGRLWGKNDLPKDELYAAVTQAIEKKYGQPTPEEIRYNSALSQSTAPAQQPAPAQPAAAQSQFPGFTEVKQEVINGVTITTGRNKDGRKVRLQ